MFERTAAGLDKCRLQRLLPKPAKPSRQLHTGFWQHGASAIDLASIWSPHTAVQRTIGVDAREPLETPPRQLRSSLVASVFLFDFLYPSAALPALQRIYSDLPRAYDGGRKALVSRSRPFSSLGPGRDSEEQSGAVSEGQTDSPSNPAQTLQDGDPQGHEVKSDHIGQGQLSEGALDAASELRIGSEELGKLESLTNAEQTLQGADLQGRQEGDLEQAQRGQRPGRRKDASGSFHTELEDLKKLDRLLSDPMSSRYNDVWGLFSRLDYDQRIRLRPSVVKYLTGSHGIVETGRANSLFRQIPVEEWDNDLLIAGILTYLRSDDLPSAVTQFKIGLETKGLDGGLEFLLAEAINSEKWATAIEIWVLYYRSELKKHPNVKPSTARLRSLSTIPAQGLLYFAFRKYLATNGRDFFHEVTSSRDADFALRAFRRHFAQVALNQPCSPNQAALILENLKDNELYNNYFINMFDRWYSKQEPKSNILKLPDLYKQFRTLPGFRPDTAVLRGFFKLYYPDRIAGLEQLYHDWVGLGGLNQWAYEKFLKLYAYRGDVETVRTLWKEYAEAYPRTLTSPRAFRSLINVHAQSGDGEAAEREIQKMQDEYGVAPDVDCWNTALKGYMRTGDYERTMECFDRISRTHEPDSFTYAHVMAMTSKKGDLEATLDFFNRSQTSGALVTKEMGLALIVAYGENRLLPEAETLCIELSKRKVSDTALWNRLLYYFGVVGDIDKCYDLLRQMRDYNMEWDDETHSMLLQALIRANQVHAAYSLVKRADDEKLFRATPEHFAVVMAAAARKGEYVLIESLHERLKKSGRPLTFDALIALVENAVDRKPGVSRTISLGREFVEYFRRILETSYRKNSNSIATGSSTISMPGNVAKFRDEIANIGRAIALLVELRDFGTIEELIALYKKLSHQYKHDGRLPTHVMSALMLTHFQNREYRKIEQLWNKTRDEVFRATMKPDGTGVYPVHKYDLARVLMVVFQAFWKMNNPDALTKAIDDVTSAGFKLTRETWIMAIRALAAVGRWERAMYWCETILMDGWEGWDFQRAPETKRKIRDTRALIPPKPLILYLQEEWMEMRRMAAWSPEVSVRLRKAQERYPRLHHAFTTSNIDTLSTTWKFTDGKDNMQELDKLLESMPYHSLLKAKESLLKDLERRQTRERRIQPVRNPRRPHDVKDHRPWKKALQSDVTEYSRKWAKLREEQGGRQPLLDWTLYEETSDAAANNESATRAASIFNEANDKDTPTTDKAVKKHADVADDATKHAADKRAAYWMEYWERYDQKPHIQLDRNRTQRFQRKKATARAGAGKARANVGRRTSEPLE